MAALSGPALSGSEDGATRVRDPGLQPERTALAWARTALALAANALLITRVGLLHARLPLTLFGLGLLMAAGGLAVYGARRSARLCHATGAAGAPVAYRGIGWSAALGLAACLGALFVTGGR